MEIVRSHTEDVQAFTKEAKGLASKCLESVADNEKFCESAFDELRQDYEKKAGEDKAALMKEVASLVENMMCKQKAMVDEKLNSIASGLSKNSTEASKTMSAVTQKSAEHDESTKAWLTSYEEMSKEWNTSIDARGAEMAKKSESVIGSLTSFTEATTNKLGGTATAESERKTNCTSELALVSQNLNAAGAKLESEMTTTVEELTQVVGSVQKSADAWLKTDTDHMANINSSVELQKSALVKQRGESHELLQGLSGEVEVYVSERLKTDMPTGKTPEKRSFNIPQPGELQGLCTPHPDLLRAQFREKVNVVAILGRRQLHSYIDP